MNWQSSCDTPTNLNYIPGLAPEYMGVLPVDPSNCKDAKYTNEVYGYAYISDGTDFLLANHPETRNIRFKPFWSCDRDADGHAAHYVWYSYGWRCTQPD